MSRPHAANGPRGGHLAFLSLASLGIVFGDIGTSVLYALRECFQGPHAVAPTPDNILGVLSLIFWSLVIVIAIKYQIFILRADNHGEGGILTLLALVAPRGHAGKRRRALVLMGIFGAALLYGDGIITPAISVLSAVEGLSVAAPFFDPYILPITIAILILLFSFQPRGTARVGAIFGPAMLVWFAVLATLGIMHIGQAPRILLAVSPWYAIDFFHRHGGHGVAVLGAVFLVVTGGEALYADMGHFGRRPIRIAWFALVLPSLLLNYFGQGAYLLLHPAAAESPFYRMAPAWALYPLVALATVATVIASQALITGAFSLTMQAIQLGYVPRMRVAHTSPEEFGQIYMPGVSWALMLACIGLVLGFGSSSKLAAAYGIAVTGTMAITTCLFYVVTRVRWKWRLLPAAALALSFLAIDLTYFGANALKIPNGGWFPLVVAAGGFTLMTTWKRGRQILAERLESSSLPIEQFLADVPDVEARPRVPGTAVFMFGNPRSTPRALLHSIKHYRILHQRVVLLSVLTRQVPYLPIDERVHVEDLGQGFYRILVYYGFMQPPNIPAALRLVKEPGLTLEPMEVSFFLGRETLISTKKPSMAGWRKKLFALMSANARTATAFFELPPNRVVELGAQIEL